MQLDTTKAPTWAKVLPGLAFLLGFMYGKVKKNCWGCALGYGSVLAAVSAIPLIMYVTKKPSDNGAISDNASGTGDVLSLMEKLAKENKKEAEFAASKESLGKALAELNVTEKQILNDSLQSYMDARKQTSAALYMEVLSVNAGKMSKKYTQPVLDAFSVKISGLQKKYAIDPQLLGKAGTAPSA